FEGARSSYEEAKRIYALYGAEDRLQWITGPGGHGALGPVSGEILAFFTRWLAEDGATPVFEPARVGAPEELLVTPTGQIGNSLGSETVASITRGRVDRLAVSSPPITSESGLAARRDQVRGDIREVAGVVAGPG